MKKFNLMLALILLAGSIFAQVHTTYLWHMQQPIYWPEKDPDNPNRYQRAGESYFVKQAGGNVYSDGKQHPLHDIVNVPFHENERWNAYQHYTKDAVFSIEHHADAGAQVNVSGCLIENLNSIAGKEGFYDYYPDWANNFSTAKSLQTSGGFPRMDMIGFTFHHALSPLVSERSLAKELQANRQISVETFGGAYSKGYWPAECSFSERIIKVLVEEGFEWSVIANSHLSRTLNDFPDGNYGKENNISPANRADKVSTNGNNYWNGTIDGRGSTLAAPYCYQAHKAKYVDPETGTEYIIDVVPMADVLSYRDGFSQQGTDLIDAEIAPYDDPSQPSIVLLAHDGDNAWGAGSSYYQQAVKDFTDAAANKGYSPTTIQQFLNDHPVPADDIVRVEDGSWVNAANDWGHPQFINWLWPLYDNTTYRFDPDGWTEDARNWAVITAAENYVWMAEDLAGGTNIEKIIYPDATSSNAEKAWHFFLPSLTSGYMYYGDADDMEVKQSLAGNHAIDFALAEINQHPGVDNTEPTVFIPQRFPYNPGGEEYGPIYNYQVTQSSSDFHVWTFAYDVSGLQSVVLKYRTDNDGLNPLDNNENDTYIGGNGVSDWISITMTQKKFPKDNVTNNPNIDFFILPTEIADLCYAEITDLSEVLVDYYVEATDVFGNVFKTPIQHVYVGEYNSFDEVEVEVMPESGNFSDPIIVSMNAATTAEGATTSIYYTLNGDTPDDGSTPYATGFELSENTTVKAIAYDTEGNVSDVVTRNYTFGDIEEFVVHFKNTSNWSDVNIYLFDWVTKSQIEGWNWPGASMEREGDSPWYKYTVAEAVQVGIVFNGDGQQSGDETRTSEGWYDYSSGQWYNQCPGDCPGEPVPELSVDPLGGTYENSLEVCLAVTNDGIITYTLDGADPRGGETYAGPFTFSSTTHLRAVATNDVGESNEIDELYEIVYPKPELSVKPIGQEFTSSISVILAATRDGDITYTLNGDDPKDGDTYDGELNFTETTRLRAIANNQNGYSEEIDETYTKVEVQCDTIYYYNHRNWSTVMVYLFHADGSVIPGWTWCGVEMTQIEDSKWYYYVKCDEEGTVGMVFNNCSGEQEDDEYNDGGWFYNGQWYDYCPGNCPGEIPEGLTVHFLKPNNWSTVSIYYWNTSPAIDPIGWYGPEITDSDGDGWFDYTLEGVSCANVIFNNSGYPQTGNFENICEESWFDVNGKVTEPGLKNASTIESLANNQAAMRIFPNPAQANREVTIQVLDETQAKYSVSVYNFAGKLVQDFDFIGQETTLSIKELMSGMYIISVMNQETKKLYKEKLFVY
jgi:hypothetical protein